MSTLRVGTRGSALAMAQCAALAERFAGEVELVPITTKGDTDRSSLQQLGGTGVFVSALRDALLDGTVDVAVHSLKDLPTAPADGIELAAVSKREDARDALVARDGLRFAELPEGAKVGTGSPRRAAQLRLARPDLEVVDIRGNVPTRIARALGDAETGEGADLDAVVLALAGLKRLGLDGKATDILDLVDFPTAPGQGALAVEIRAGDAAARAAVAKTDHASTRASVDAERRVLAGLEAGCAAPLGAQRRGRRRHAVPERQRVRDRRLEAAHRIPRLHARRHCVRGARGGGARRRRARGGRAHGGRGGRAHRRRPLMRGARPGGCPDLRASSGMIQLDARDRGTAPGRRPVRSLPCPTVPCES